MAREIKMVFQFQWELDTMDTGLPVDCFQPSTLETASPSGFSESELLSQARLLC